MRPAPVGHILPGRAAVIRWSARYSVSAGSAFLLRPSSALLDTQSPGPTAKRGNRCRRSPARSVGAEEFDNYAMCLDGPALPGDPFRHVTTGFLPFRKISSRLRCERIVARTPTAHALARAIGKAAGQFDAVNSDHVQPNISP